MSHIKNYDLSWKFVFKFYTESNFYDKLMRNLRGYVQHIKQVNKSLIQVKMLNVWHYFVSVHTWIIRYSVYSNENSNFKNYCYWCLLIIQLIDLVNLNYNFKNTTLPPCHCCLVQFEKLQCIKHHVKRR
jgi:hypothetical protein